MNSKLDFLSYQTNRTGFYVPHHKHNCYELVYYVSGSGKTTISDVEYEYSANTFTIILQNALHDETCIEESNLIFFGFSYDNNPFPVNNGLYKDTSNANVHKLMLKMKEELLSKNPYYNIKLDLLVSEVLIEVNRITQGYRPQLSDLSYIINFIHENYNSDIDINLLAELSGYSYHRFRHIFKEKTGLSPNKYIIQTKIEAAKKQLKNLELSISEIAFNCGFTNSSQFTFMFKNSTGQTPNEYRKNLVDASKIKQII